MVEKRPWFEKIVFPALLRHARSTYGTAMRRALVTAGYDDVPKNGLYVIGGLALGAGGVPLSQLVKELGISKQAAGQLVDTLVLRGYIERTVDNDDRRRLTVTLTERGKGAAAVQTAARAKIDAGLIAAVGEQRISVTRRTLAALVELGRDVDGRVDDH
ncbi:MAG TPA: MarR family transcriptional regulator [Pseudolabrys sp.]|jgi:DNA-binding MarR family transcriptional regulator